MTKLKPTLSDLPSSLLIGFRDALSTSLSISITFADSNGDELEIEKSKIGRKYIQSVCQKFHFNKEECPETWKMCKQWDNDATVAILNNEESPQECWCKFACFAVPIKVGQDIEGIILAGERRIQGKYEEEDYVQVLKTGKEKVSYSKYYKSLKPNERKLRLTEYEEQFFNLINSQKQN